MVAVLQRIGDGVVVVASRSTDAGTCHSAKTRIVTACPLVQGDSGRKGTRLHSLRALREHHGRHRGRDVHIRCRPKGRPTHHVVGEGHSHTYPVLR